MKKRLSEERTRYLTRIRIKSFLNQKRRKRARVHPPDHGVAAPTRARRYKHRLRTNTSSRHTLKLAAPENFSLIHNPEEMIQFFQSIYAALEKGLEPSLDMRAVKSLGPDAIAVLNSTLDMIALTYKIAISGWEPRIPALANILRRSGFYEHVTPSRGVKYIGADHGMISHEMEHIVDAPKAYELVAFAMRTLTGTATTHRASYSALGELMHNTFDHASREVTGRERWWASVYFDEETRVAHFTFLDNGVGILGSRPVRLLDPLRRALDINSDQDLLMNIFQGKLASRTEISWRGQGLPRVYQRVKSGHLTDMTILTNRVIGNLDRDDFRLIDVEFPGTLYHWELHIT